MLRSAFIAGLTALACSQSAQAYMMIFDEFETDHATSVLNAGLTHWSVSGGTVDYIRSGDYGIQCLGGGCVDMDGSTGDAGRITSLDSFAFTSGSQYRLDFDYSGNQRTSAFDEMVFGYGTTQLGSVGAPGAAGFQHYTLFFTAAADETASFYFEGIGGDNIGLILDNVWLQPHSDRTDGGVPTEVPEPSSLALAGLGLLGLGYLRRRV